MAKTTQCGECGAVLLPEDLFCGECGASRPDVSPVSDTAAAETVAEPVAEEPVVAASLPSATAQAGSSKNGWRTAVIVLLALGACLCLMGISTFLLFGLTVSDATTAQEDWLYATFLCLLPIGGMGIVLALTGAGIWYSRLRNR